MKWPQNFVNKVICGDALEIMKQIPDGTIDMAITSPPYYGLRDYGKDSVAIYGGNSDCKHDWQASKTSLEHEYRQGIGSNAVSQKQQKGWHEQPSAFCVKCGAWKGQIGLEPHPQLYVEHLVEIFRELKRILKPEGSFYLNMGDTYCGSNQGYGQKQKSKTGFQFIGTGQYASSKCKTPQSQIVRKETWLQPKQLLLMPTRIAIALQEDGWILRNDIIYHKRNPLPSSVKDRLSNTYEHIFFFVKNHKYFYDLDSIREPHTSLKDLGRKRLDTKTPKHDIALKQKAGKIGPSGYLVQHPLGKNPGDVLKTQAPEYLDFFRKKGGGGHYDHGGINNPEARKAIIERMKTRGKNPGDVIQINGDFIQHLLKEVYCRLNRNSKTYKGKNRRKDKNAKIIQVFDGKKIRDTAREILKEKGIYSTELVEYIHDHFGHPLGKNPGDIIHADASMRRNKTLDESYKKSGMRNPPEPSEPNAFHPRGKNPGDVLLERSDKRAVLSKKQRLHTFYSHSKRGIELNNPLGKNPGDVILTKHDLAVNRVGNISYADPLHTKAYNIKGKNPGDVAKYPPHEPRHFQLSQMGIQHGGHTGKTVRHDHPIGKNPGDVIHTPNGDFVYGSEEYADWYFSKRKKSDWKSEGEKIRYTKGNIKDIEQYPHPCGSNPGDFWTITVKPFREAHFAVYPEELCLKPIIASCPELVCKKCSKSVIKKIIGTKGFGDSFNIRVRDMQIHPEKWGRLYKATEKEKKKYDEKQYRHTTTREEIINKCNCNAGFEPGVVLDMFAGSGTTGVVAKKLGRRYILIELKPEYCKMARKRLNNI